jgi:hypothetical protein
MPDNLNLRGPEDPQKININQSWEVQYWTKKLGVSESKLRMAVSNAGPMVVNVKNWLSKNSYF